LKLAPEGMIFLNTVELHLSGIIGTASHPDMQKIQKIGFFFEKATLAVLGSAVAICCMYPRPDLQTNP
jgi:hypothetical protein